MRSTNHSGWLSSLLSNLDNFGPDALAAATFIRERGTRVSVHAQPTGARWTIDRRIEIHPQYTQVPPDDPYAVALIIHEVRHLQQGMLTALSVYGELDAWQLQFAFLKRVTGHYQGAASRETLIEQLMLLPLALDRIVLENARLLMKAYAGPRYRVDLLTPYPLPLEILYRITHKEQRLHGPNRS